MSNVNPHKDRGLCCLGGERGQVKSPNCIKFRHTYGKSVMYLLEREKALLRDPFEASVISNGSLDDEITIY
jgi:hypothetical protein